jgi:DNA-binding transcriptional ArsR family regulator
MTRKTKPPIALYSALADATRCRIVELLLAGSVPVHQLADAFAISRPAISRHLRVLKEAGLVAEVKKGRENLYALRAEKLLKATAWIEALSAEPVEKPTQPKEAAPVAKAAEREAKPIKPVRQDAPVGINQMGFDF